jgi:hypothetical protein
MKRESFRKRREDRKDRQTSAPHPSRPLRFSNSGQSLFHQAERGLEAYCQDNADFLVGFEGKD